MSVGQIFEIISIEPPYKKIYQRLGYKDKATKLTAAQQRKTDFFIEEAAGLISIKGSALRNNVSVNDGSRIVLDGDVTFSSAQLSFFLRNCREALLMGSTAGKTIMEAIQKKTAQHNLAAAVVYDATASEMTDAALDWIMDYFNNQLRREAKRLLPRRFSAGYADFHLKNQQTIYNQLQMAKIGVAINANFILLPEKSVTAISGICD